MTRTEPKLKPRLLVEMVLLCRNNATTINAHVKLKTGSNTGSDTLTRDPTRPDPTKIADLVIRDPETRFRLCMVGPSLSDKVILEPIEERLLLPCVIRNCIYCIRVCQTFVLAKSLMQRLLLVSVVTSILFLVSLEKFMRKQSVYSLTENMCDALLLEMYIQNNIICVTQPDIYLF